MRAFWAGLAAKQSVRANISTAVCVVAALVLAANAYGAEWRYFFTNFGNVSFYLDVAGTYRLPNGDIRAWEKQLWSKPDPDLDGETGMLWLIEVNCDQRKYAFRDIKPIKGTLKSMKLAYEMKSGYVNDWEFFGPNDLDEARYSQLCKAGK